MTSSPSPAYVVIKAANEFKDKTTAINQLWQTEFTYLWGWYYLSTVLDDFSRYIVAWRLGPTMCASDVTATLDQALTASGGGREWARTPGSAGLDRHADSRVTLG